jgi:pimeloyl-ACP methyl ester carboxylesterase
LHTLIGDNKGMAPLLLIPGVLCDNTLWKDMAPSLEKSFDIQYAAPPVQKTIKEMAQAILKSAPPTFWLVGFSLGGWVALEIAHLQPQRLQGLILISSSRGEISSATRDSMRAAIKEMRTGQFERYIHNSLALYLTKGHSHDPKITHDMVSMMQQVGPEIGSQQYEALVSLEKPFDFLGELHCPTLVIRGEEDGRRPLEMDQAFARAIPQAEFSVIGDAAHFIPLEQPALLASQIEAFIKQHRP